jgi:hypothetical protein
MNSSLKDKLTDFESTPPPKAWDKIVAALDDTLPASITEKLYEYQQAPPASVWNKINNELSKEQESAKLIPLLSRFSKNARYSGAAIILLVLGLTAWFIINNINGTSDLASNQTIIPVPGKTQDSSGVSITDPSNKVVFTPETKQVPGPRPFVVASKPKKSILRPGKPMPSASSGMVKRRQVMDLSLPVDRYMVYSDGQNAPVKLSKKLFEVFACIQEDLDCKQRIQSLQQRISTSAVASDFTGMLDMLHQLKEKQ